ncbi:hypothetical protein ACGFX4_39865 [Kitasatospora sp. NPDC048365]|uniref:hypothetical protein n=1 Tax=Kitasatospora sp. NPDC048365 TaxID=3364050 RepID=UPI003723EEFB
MMLQGDLSGTTDERLCWLLLRDEPARRTKRAPWWRLLGLVERNGVRAGLAYGHLPTEHARDMRKEITSGRMADYALAVDDAAERLSAEERRVLREAHTLPEWFMEDVERRYREIRRRS